MHCLGGLLVWMPARVVFATVALVAAAVASSSAGARSALRVSSPTLAALLGSDTYAEELARTAQTVAETYFTDSRYGSYAGLTVAKAERIEPPLRGSTYAHTNSYRLHTPSTSHAADVLDRHGTFREGQAAVHRRTGVSSRRLVATNPEHGADSHRLSLTASAGGTSTVAGEARLPVDENPTATRSSPRAPPAQSWPSGRRGEELPSRFGCSAEPAAAASADGTA